MADENREIDLNREIDQNEDVDMSKEYDLTEKIVSLERENHMLLRKIEKLEGTYRVELEAKEREIQHQKQRLKQLDNRWKTHTDMLVMVTNELTENWSNDLLRKVEMLESNHRVEIEELENEIANQKLMLVQNESWWEKEVNMIYMTKVEFAETQVNVLLRKIDKLKATHKVELDAKEREIEQRKHMLEELDSRWRIHKDLVCMAKDKMAEKRIMELLTKISELEKKLEIQDNMIS